MAITHITSCSSTPEVSVLMPVYNTRKYLCAAIDSILSQTLRNIELIILDDGSTDDSADIADCYAAHDPRARVLRLPHAGIANVNQGVRTATAPLLARMDSDDIAEPMRLEKQAAFLATYPQVVAVGTWLIRTDPQGNPAGEQRPPTAHAEIDAALLRCDGSAIVQGTTMFRRDALLAVGGWRDSYGWIEDLDLYLRLAERGQLANIPEFLYRYRRHPRSVCATHYQVMRDRLQAMLTEAYARRKLGAPLSIAELRPDLAQTDSAGDLYRSWACHAIHNGNGRAARRHAMSALLREPLSPRTWRVLRWSLTA